MAIKKKTVTVFICERCQHEWQTEDGKEPIRCANCKSPYWNRPRVVKKK